MLELGINGTGVKGQMLKKTLGMEYNTQYILLPTHGYLQQVCVLLIPLANFKKNVPQLKHR